MALAVIGISGDESWTPIILKGVDMESKGKVLWMPITYDIVCPECKEVVANMQIGSNLSVLRTITCTKCHCKAIPDLENPYRTSICLTDDNTIIGN